MAESRACNPEYVLKIVDAMNERHNRIFEKSGMIV
jgi:hypothetical protein